MSDESTASLVETGYAPEPTRRDLLTLIPLAGAGLFGASITWALIDSMNPSADVIAAGAPIDIDLRKVAAGQQIIILWRGTPIAIVNRPASALQVLQSPGLLARLSDPNSTVHQQPPYAQNWHRSIRPQYVVLVAICTHLGCLPGYMPKPDPTTPTPNWPGGYFCPCHGSKYDLAGRVWSGVPAPYNLPVPPHHFTNDHTVRIGENPAGQTFDLASVVQM